MTTDRLRQIRERWAKATPGPWVLGRTFEEEDERGKLCCAYIFDPSAHGGVLSVDGWAKTVDMLAIAAAPEDIAWLLKRVEELEAIATGVIATDLLLAWETDRLISELRRLRAILDYRDDLCCTGIEDHDDDCPGMLADMKHKEPTK